MTDVKSILEAISLALGTIKTVADTPGVNMIPYVSVVSTAVGALQAAINAGVNVAPYVIAIKNTFSGDGIPTAEQIAALRVKTAELEAKIQLPLPPPEEGEEY
jgi:hypothetical protein